MTEFTEVALISMSMSFALGTIVGLLWRIILQPLKK